MRKPLRLEFQWGPKVDATIIGIKIKTPSSNSLTSDGRRCDYNRIIDSKSIGVEA
jgi:hypothetical protein